MILKPKRIDVLSHSLNSVSLEKVKEQLRILDDDENDLLLSYVQAATCDLEEWTGYDLMPSSLLAVFNWCANCRPCFVLTGRPFSAVTKIEVLQDDVYVELTTAQYTVSHETWETYVCINSDVEIDRITTDGCRENTEPVKITYATGKTREVAVSSITTTAPNIATVELAAAHGLSNFDQVILSDTGKVEYDGTFTATVTAADKFTFGYLGSDPGAVATGICTIPEIPPQLKLAVMQMVAMMYENRGDCADTCGKVPCMAQRLARKYRRYNVRGVGANDCCCG